MKRILLPTPVIAATLWFLGCGTPTQTAVNSSNQVNYNKGTSYTFKQNQLDTAGGTYGQDKPIPSSTDTVTSTVVATNQTVYGKSNVTVLVNTHSSGASADTTYISQDDNGNYWHYNYGLEAVNNNQAVLRVIQPIQAGWVLQSKLNANAGDTWTADSTVLNIMGANNTPLLSNALVKITAVEQADTSIVVQGSSVTAKHAIHTVSINTGLGAPITSTVDTYVSANAGVVVNVVHSAHITSLLFTG